MSTSVSRRLALPIIVGGLLTVSVALYFNPHSRYDLFSHGAVTDQPDEIVYFNAPHHPDWPTVNTTTVTDHKLLNRQHIRDLQVCMAMDTCGKNQKNVVLLAEKYFWEAIDLGWLGGEHVWANTIMKSLRSLGYTFLVGTDVVEVVEQYQMFPDLVKVVVGGWPLDEPDTSIKSESFPTGIPRWKGAFDMQFFSWGGRSDDIGQEWVIHAERPGPRDPEHKTLNYIGYSMEDECKKTAIVPHDQRPMSAWFYSKQASYAFAGFPEFGWNTSYFELATESLKPYGLTFRGAYNVDPTFLPERVEYWPIHELAGIDNIGKIGAEQFAEEIAKTRMVVGIGQPWLAPSAYLGLCLGSPFLNVLKRWDPEDPEDRTKWSTQHDVLAALDPPYVHNVRAGDYDGFVKAIEYAIQNPTPSYIDPEMTEVRVRERVHTFVEGDWKAKATEIWEERVSNGQLPYWTL